MLVMVTVFWGSSCLFTKVALEELQEFNLMALRFLIGFAVSLPAVSMTGKLKADMRTVRRAALLSANYFVVVAFMTFGVRYTTVSKAGLLTCLAGVFVPLICVLLFRMRIGRRTALCAVSTLVGVYLLTMGGSVEALGVNLGDVLCTLCSLFFAVHIMLIGFMVKRTDAITLTVFQMGFVGLYNTAAAFLFESPGLPQTGATWFYVLWLGVVCGVSAALLQNVAQKYTSETHAGIIFTLEPVFALIFAYAFLGEMLTPTGYAGAAVLMASIVILELP